MPRGRPNTEQGADPRTNKMEAVRRAMDNLGYDASPLEIQKFIKENFDVDMNANMISSYKSTLRAKAGLAGRRKKRGRPKKTAAAATAAAPAATFHDAVPWKDLRTIKDIAGRIGKKGLRELVELLD
jgi:ribosomal protein L19E